LCPHHGLGGILGRRGFAGGLHLLADDALKLGCWYCRVGRGVGDLTAADRYSERGDEALCLCCLRRAQRLRPDDPDLLLRLADTAWGAGRSTEARTLYLRLLELRPSHPHRARLLERLAPPDESAPDGQTRGHASAARTNVFSARVSVK